MNKGQRNKHAVTPKSPNHKGAYMFKLRVKKILAYKIRPAAKHLVVHPCTIMRKVTKSLTFCSNGLISFLTQISTCSAVSDTRLIFDQNDQSIRLNFAVVISSILTFQKMIMHFLDPLLEPRENLPSVSATSLHVQLQKLASILKIRTKQA